MQKDLQSFRPLAEAWKIRGNCAAPEIDPRLFEIDASSGPASASFNRAKTELAVAICHGGGGCPVMDLCEKAHNDSEKAWMVVGGKLPTKEYISPRTHAPKKSGSPSSHGSQFCKNGHDLTLPEALTAAKRPRCRECKRGYDRTYDAIRKDHATMGS